MNTSRNLPAVIPFHFNEHELRIIQDSNGNLSFVARDVCEILELTGNPGHHTRRLDDDQKGVIQIHTLGGPQDMQTVTESGFYDLVLRSDKPQAKPFRKWVTSEVLPAIRKTGCYSLPSTQQAFDPSIGRKYAAAKEIVRTTLDMSRRLGHDPDEARLMAVQEVKAITGLDISHLLAGSAESGTPETSPKREREVRS